MLSRQILFAHQKCQDTVGPQRIVVIEILVTQGQAIDPLRYQGLDAMLDAVLIAVVGETGSQPIQQTQTLINLP